MTLLTTVCILFFIMDPIGNIQSYLTYIKKTAPNRYKWIVFREMGIVLLTMLLFYLIGEYLLDFLKISDESIHFTSGIILFLFAIKIIFPSSSSPRENLPKEEPFIIPLAIPLIAGPSLLVTIMLFAHLEEEQAILIPAIIIAWLISLLLLLGGPLLQRLLGNNGLAACEKLTAMVLVMLSIQRFTEGIRQFVLHC